MIRYKDDKHKESPCINCKWLIVGEYSQVYHGSPIGCSKPIDKTKPGFRCFEKLDDQKHE